MHGKIFLYDLNYVTRECKVQMFPMSGPGDICSTPLEAVTKADAILRSMGNDAQEAMVLDKWFNESWYKFLDGGRQ